MSNVNARRGLKMIAAATVAAAVLAGASAVPAGAASPSFSCAGRLAPAEAAVCSDDGLAALDRTLATAYTRMLDSFPAGEKSTLRDVQKAWIAQRDACGTDKACIRAAYEARIGQLHGGGPAPAQTSCAASVGAEQAAIYVRQCAGVSPATHPPCNASNACALIISEIRRGCALIGSGAPAFCAAYR
jgi:uncharacterized protein YecT (DUF1311 family)